MGQAQILFHKNNTPQALSADFFPNESILNFVRRHLSADAVPSLCHSEALKPCGSCRICSVEVTLATAKKSKVMASCHTPVAEGMNIAIDSPQVLDLRKTIQELLKNNSEQLSKKSIAVDITHPYIHSDLSKCIHCYRCVRACDEIQGQFVLGVQGRGISNQIIKGHDQSFMESPCVSCGACVNECPTDALTDRHSAARSKAKVIVQTTCTYCGVGCQLKVHKTEQDILGISPKTHTCVKGRFAFEFYNHPERLKTPLIRKNNQLVPATWDEALDLIAEKLSQIKTQYGPDALAGISSSRCTNEENYLMQKFFRVVIGTNNIDGCARVCHAPTAYGMQQTFGTGAATNSFVDLKNTDCILLIGSNTTEAHPVVGAQVKQAIYKGAKLIVIDPRQIELTQMADSHLALLPGTNLPLLTLFAYYLLQEKLLDQKFIETRTENFEEFRKYLENTNPDEIEKITGVPKSEVQKAARLYGSAKAALSLHGLGITEHYQGSQTMMLLSCIAMMTGNIGRPGVGINPLRGQNNVQGMADMGVQPHQGTGYMDVHDPMKRAMYEKHYGISLSNTKGMKIPEMLNCAAEQKLKALWIMGEDIIQTDPDTSRVRQALGQLNFLVVQELFLTDTARAAHVVMPASSFFEKEGTFTNGERRVQRVNPVIKPIAGTMPDGQIIVEVMNRMGFKQNKYKASEILAEVASISPDYRGIRFEDLGTEGLQWPLDENGKGTRILHEKNFKRGKGKFFNFQYLPTPEFKFLKEYPLILTTGRLLEHYNCGSMTRRTPNVKLVTEDLLSIHPIDAKARGLKSGDLCEVKSVRGTTQLKIQVTDEVRPGVVFTTFHFPEIAINQITSGVSDLNTMTPEFKVAAVQVRSL